VTGTSLAS